ncbi:peptidase family M28 [Lasiosphaeris hirsuta]|uniref:Peptide hydrolase n=1 Tax=Lasiosphaeris hirsuta TaxID=260670 RepID=A0AA39ZRK6_9PEZI|nr:peptidase family M28 [Lasiosphaeris hirsuta]
MVLPVIAKPRIDSEKLQADITTAGLMSNLGALNDIALANGGNRAFGLPGYAASVDYVWGRISNISGNHAWKQDFSALFNLVESVELKVNNESVYVVALTYSPSTSKQGITAQVIAGPDGAAGCDDESYNGLNVTGKIVLIQRWRCPTGGTLAGRLLPAARAGAAAVIIYNDVDAHVTGGTLSSPNTQHVPGGFIDLTDGQRLKEKLTAGNPLHAYFQQTQIVENRTTQNVFVETIGGDPENVIVLGAHLDSVQAGPGINDDGSGTSLLLELFLATTRYSTQNKIRFSWWAAEEEGLLGSLYYCSHLNASEGDKILAYLNFDMVSKGYFGVGDGDGSTYGSVAPRGSEVIERIYIDYFEARGHAVTPARITNGSDYYSFWEVLKKPFGYLNTGTAAAQDPCYHKACDTIENPDAKTITTNARAAAHMLAVLSLNGTHLLPKSPANQTRSSGIHTPKAQLSPHAPRRKS